ncbi:MAG: ABC transporter permease [Actinomycetota bacterium]
MLLAASFFEDLFRGFLQGTPSGAVFALIALGFVLTYKTSGVFNLAFGAQAYVAAAMYFKTQNDWEWPILPGVILAVFVVSPAIGLLLERLIFRHLRTATAVSKLVITIGLSVALPAIFELAANFTPVSGRPPSGIVPDGSSVFYDPFGVYRFSRDELAMMIVGLIAMVLLWVMFRFSSLGLSMRAVVESSRMTELNGIPADRISAIAWAVSSMFAGLAGVLIAPRFNTLISNDFFSLVVVAIAAAAIGRLVSLPRALLGGLLLGWFIAIFRTFLPRWSDDIGWLRPIQENLTPSLPFVVLFGILVFWPAIRRAAETTDPLAGVDPPPPALAAAERHPTLTLMTRTSAIVFLAVIAYVVANVAGVDWIRLITKGVIFSIIFLSITVMTGLAGQISLAQGSFAAIGGFTVFQMADRFDTSVLVAALLGAVIAAVVGAILAIPVLRLGGIWLAIATLAFAFFFDAVIVKLSWVGGGDTALIQGTRVPRPVMGPIDFENDKTFLVLCVIVLVIVSLAVIQLREGTIGRTLRAMRGSEVAAESIGINPAKARIIAFATSAFIAALGGALLSIAEENVKYEVNYTPAATLFWLVLVVALSARTVEGAIQAGVAFTMFERLILQGELFEWIFRTDDLPIFPISGKWRFILFGLSSVQFAKHPEGLVEHGKRRFTAKMNARLTERSASSEPEQPVAEGTP